MLQSLTNDERERERERRKAFDVVSSTAVRVIFTSRTTADRREKNILSLQHERKRSKESAELLRVDFDLFFLRALDDFFSSFFFPFSLNIL